MSIYGQNSLLCGLWYDRNGQPTYLNTFLSNFTTPKSAIMRNLSSLSFTPDTLTESIFIDSKPLQFESAQGQTTLASHAGDLNFTYFRLGDDCSALSQTPSDVSRYFPGNNSEFCNPRALEMPQMSYNSHQLQGYYLPTEIQQNDPRRHPMASMYNYSRMATMGGSPCLTSPTLSHSPSFRLPSPDMLIREDIPSPLTRSYDEDEDDSCDKPYAQLIYEALKHAPGHRMMLREIYDWFLRNTTKPKESGSNGWQNSIRHNLSMNQAFENDRSEPSYRNGHARKSNSVWILTDLAVQNGVQSTTRYRKTGKAKKSNVNRAPALVRQRSGAKGGQAARRAAKLRRREQDSRNNQLSTVQSSPGISIYGYGDAYAQTLEGGILSAYTSTTPPDDRLFGMPSVPPLSPYPTELPTFQLEEGWGEESVQGKHDLGLQDLSLQDLGLDGSEDPCKTED